MYKKKIGYSKYGGIFVGSGINSIFHKHDYVVSIFSFGTPMKVEFRDYNQTINTAGIFINRNVEYRLFTSNNMESVFIHIDPYSHLGIKIQRFQLPYTELILKDFAKLIEMITEWYLLESPDETVIETIMEYFIQRLLENHSIAGVIDYRIEDFLQKVFAKDDDPPSLGKAASITALSPSRFSHLFKAETGCTYRDFQKSRKLSKSLAAMYAESSLTKAAFHGGFSDQPHFTNTFKNTFGINPSESKDS